LRRARDTARLAGFAAPTVDPLLTEWDYGDYEGLTTKEIRAERPGWELWNDGCPGGESPVAVLARARAFLARLDLEDGDVLVFSHGHFIRALTLAFVDLPAGAGARFALDTATVSVLRAGERGRLVQVWNAGEHLPGARR
jgi:probable phosphoglycerate mutase